MTHAIFELMKDEARTLCGWAATIGAAVVGFWLSEGTAYHQFAVGVFLSSVSLFAVMALFEALWRAIEDRLPSRNEK